MSRQQRAQIDAIMRRPRPEARTVAEMRAGFAASRATTTVPSGIRTTETTLGGRRALLVEPADRQRPGTILYLHGGAWALGSPETSLALTAHLVVRTGMRALSLDYRLAPENPFPAANHDTVAAYRALLDNGENPAGIAVVGDSAGGGLSVTSLLAARDEGLPMPAAVVAFSGGFDATLSAPSMDSKAGIDPLFTRESLGAALRMYCDGQDLRQPLLSPAISADFSGFPPMLLQAGTNEVLLDDSTRLASRAIGAGVDVILDVTADVPHAFQNFAGVLDEAGQALDLAAFFLTRHVVA
ncbi:alpha/beta hydrolase [Amycolatopsis pithecellobii]|uniref:Alpha/beta hydrolase fold domain-containing protein n=1 Tax=Amycolatopsis pithecellobii TaxID=664692 RepID=A0A6N7YVJ6_9PSEU|nr:alpha/beta hydrolase [Amycolatopsis pithecellobii]MTD52893.1 alpha/beta hydrolase fold domain-containing protein [Amycolatopsis pithecellobii]